MSTAAAASASSTTSALLALHLSSPLPPTPLYSSSPDNTTLSDLSTAALAAHTTLLKLELGLPLHIVLETSTSGPVVLQTFLNPEKAINVHGGARQQRGLGEVEEQEQEPEGELAEDEEAVVAPLLVATIVAAGREQLGDARRAVKRLQTAGSDFQRRWVKDREEEWQSS